MTDAQKKDALLYILTSIVEAVKVAGTRGAPGGVLFAAMMGAGCTLDQFNQLMAALQRAGKVTKRGELYFAV